MKVVILAAGKGSRIENYTGVHSKCLITFKGKPIILYAIDYLSRFEFFNEFIIVVGHDADNIIRYIGNTINGKKITYIKQKVLNGIIGAIEVVKEEIGNDNFYMQLGDEVFVNQHIENGYNTFTRNNLDCLFGVVHVEDKSQVKNCYSVEYNDNKIINFVEKPKEVFNNICGTGSVFFESKVLNWLSEVEYNKNGSRDMVTLFDLILQKTGKIKSYNTAEQYVNVNSEKDLRFLNEIEKLSGKSPVSQDI